MPRRESRSRPCPEETNKEIFFFPDGDRVLTSSFSDSFRVRDIKIWHVETGQELGRFRVSATTSHLTSTWHPMLLNPDGTRLLFGNRMWDVGTGQPVLTFPTDFIAFAISPDEAAASLRRIRNTSQGSNSRGAVRF